MSAALKPGTPVRIDARRLLCPLPVLRLAKALRTLPPGTEALLLADDPMAAIDVPHFCAEQGHAFLGAEQDPDGSPAYRIRRS